MNKYLLIFTVGFSAFAFAAPESAYLNPWGIEAPFKIKDEAERAKLDELRQKAIELHKIREEKLGPLSKTFHAPVHGCLKGKFTLSPSRPERAKHGFFADHAPYEVWAKFANIDKPDDRIPGLRSMAVLVVDPELASLNGVPRGQHFLANDTERHFISNIEDLLLFMKHQALGTVPDYIALNPPVHGTRVQDAMKNQADAPLSLLNRAYHSRSPYWLGPSLVKFAFRPCDNNGIHRTPPAEHHLTVDLTENAKTEKICFHLTLQFHEAEKLRADGTELTSLDNLTKTWGSDIVEVGTLEFPPQDITGNSETCEKFRFDIWNSISEHAPYGDFNKGRWYIYSGSRSQTMR